MATHDELLLRRFADTRVRVADGRALTDARPTGSAVTEERR
jgi:energy-coupling factor transport system ATP-binding protein